MRDFGVERVMMINRRRDTSTATDDQSAKRGLEGRMGERYVPGWYPTKREVSTGSNTGRSSRWELELEAETSLGGISCNGMLAVEGTLTLGCWIARVDARLTTTGAATGTWISLEAPISGVMTAGFGEMPILVEA